MKTYVAISVWIVLHLASVAGRVVVEKRVVGGEEVGAGDATFSVSLWYMQPNIFTATTGMHHVCGGTLVRPQWVLTSGHCFDNATLPGLDILDDWLVVVGDHDLNTTDGTEQFFTVVDIFFPEQYNLSVPTGDVALLKLNASAVLGDNAGTIAVNDDPSCVQEGSVCTVYGWGQTQEEPYGKGSRLPYKAELTVVDHAQCAQNYSAFGYTVTSLEFCAAADGRDACAADSGGPLVCPCQGENKLSGVVFYGNGCARPSYPGVYERVDTFKAWIDSTVDQDS